MTSAVAHDGDGDSPIRVLIAPAQSSYFAGETLAVTITFTNTRSSNYVPIPRSAPYTHKRGSHSISSAPLARPPTSPGMPSRSVVVPGGLGSSSNLGWRGLRRNPDGDTELPSRKGLIGHRDQSNSRTMLGLMASSKSDLLPELIEQRRKRLLAKSLSVSISPGELEKQLPEGTLAKATSPRSPYSTNFGSGSLGIINESNSPSARSQSRSPTPPSPTTVSSAFETPSVSASTSTAPSSPVISPTSESNGFHYSFAAPSVQFATAYDATRHAGQLNIGLGPPPKGSKPTLNSNTASTIPQRPASLDLPLYSAPPYTKASYSQPHPQLHHSQPHLPHTPQSSNAPYPSPYLQPRTASSISSPSFPIPSHSKTELILYAYVQLTGSLILLPVSNTTTGTSFNSSMQQPETHAMKRLRAKLTRRTVMGGGSMDITPSLQSMRSSSGVVTPTLLSAAPSLGSGIGPSPRLGPGTPTGRPQRPRIRATHARSPSLAAEFFSNLLSPTSPSPVSPPSPLTNGMSRSALHRSSSSVSDITSMSINAGADDPRNRDGATTDPDVSIDPEFPLPMFDSQPSMLAVDLSLGPGESKSYTYAIKLPSVLPPTFKGRSIRFSYELSVGVCRSAPSSPGAVFTPPSLASGNGVSRIVKVPIRVYNHVAVGRVPRPYDLLWPIGRRIRDGKVEGIITEVEVGKRGKAVPVLPNVQDRESQSNEGSLDDLREYARKLLMPTQGIGQVRGEDDDDREDAPIGCREAVEILTRNPKKVSYDVNKDGVKVAVLTFTKSAYRLGETVLGVVEFNNRKGRARVLQMSAMLEAHERIPPSLASANAAPLKRVHAEQHQTFVVPVLRTTFSLDIPSDTSPAFQVVVGEAEDGAGGLEWQVRLSLLVAVASEDASVGTEGVRFKGMIRDGPRGVWGSAWRASPSIAPMEKLEVEVAKEVDDGGAGGVRGWAYYLAAALLGASTGEDMNHEGDELDEDDYDGINADPEGGVGQGVSYGGSESGWGPVGLEMVECSVPVVVRPGNTAFKALSVEFCV